MFFKIKCYINSIKNNIINISIYDNNELLRFQQNLSKLYKNLDQFDYNKNNFDLKLLNSTKIQLNTSYNSINDLHGISVIISGSSKYYCFTIDKEDIDIQTNTFVNVKKIIKGYTLYANKIVNDSIY
jgi:hypothetical protein